MGILSVGVSILGIDSSVNTHHCTTKNIRSFAYLSEVFFFLIKKIDSLFFYALVPGNNSVLVEPKTKKFWHSLSSCL